jgi:hypothetical protein
VNILANKDSRLHILSNFELIGLAARSNQAKQATTTPTSPLHTKVICKHCTTGNIQARAQEI